MKVIAYNQDNGVAAIIYPTPEALERFGIEAIAAKDVPDGKTFAIVDIKDLPSDADRDKWCVNGGKIVVAD